MSESNRSNFIDTSRLHVVICIVKIAWRVTSVECFCVCYFKKNTYIAEKKFLKKLYI